MTDTLNRPNIDLTHENKQTITSLNNDAALNASDRLQNFFKTSNLEQNSMNSNHLTKINEHKSLSTLSRFKFLRKKPKSIDITNQVGVHRFNHK